MRRAVANSHLYQDADEFCRKLEMSLAAQYAGWLAQTSRHKSLLRMQRRLLSAPRYHGHPQLVQHHRAFHNQKLAICLMTAAQKHHRPNERYARELNTFLRASGLFFKFLKWYVNGDDYIAGLDAEQRNDLKEMAVDSVDQVLAIGGRLTDVQGILGDRIQASAENDDNEQLVSLFKDFELVSQNIIHVSRGLLEACTSKDGQMRVLLPQQTAFLTGTIQTHQCKISDLLAASQEAASNMASSQSELE
ncbi:MAG: hypothetical protein SGARI_007274 [Bacillariaceae sp.]